MSGSTIGASGDLRARLPRFRSDNRSQNAALVDALHALASEMGVRPVELAIAWVLSKGQTIVPVVGARTRAQLGEALGALALRLSPADVSRLESAVPAGAIAGTRYDEHQMRVLDSER